MTEISNQPVSADASSYVRNCNEPTVLGLHPAWVGFVVAAFFMQTTLVFIISACGIGFCILAKKNNATLFDMARRIRRKIAGPVRKTFRSI